MSKYGGMHYETQFLTVNLVFLKGINVISDPEQTGLGNLAFLSFYRSRYTYILNILSYSVFTCLYLLFGDFVLMCLDKVHIAFKEDGYLSINMSPFMFFKFIRGFIWGFSK